MVFTQKSSKKRPAPAQGGPKPKKLHVESGSLKAHVKKRSRPVTLPLDARDSESEDDIDVEEDELDHHEEQEGDESAMQVDPRTDEHNIPKDPSSNPKKKVASFFTAICEFLKPKKNCYRTNVE
jgi:pumilio homology domain family member 6